MRSHFSLPGIRSHHSVYSRLYCAPLLLADGRNQDDAIPHTTRCQKHRSQPVCVPLCISLNQSHPIPRARYNQTTGSRGGYAVLLCYLLMNISRCAAAQTPGTNSTGLSVLCPLASPSSSHVLFACSVSRATDLKAGYACHPYLLLTSLGE
jgi:hypothetical protein